MRVILEWKCTNCGYLITHLQHESARADFQCRCGSKNWSDYVIARWGDEDDEAS